MGNQTGVGGSCRGAVRPRAATVRPSGRPCQSISDVPEAEALPPSHPLFASHFTKRLYDAEDFRNDDVAPFGTDEGWDAVRASGFGLLSSDSPSVRSAAPPLLPATPSVTIQVP